MKMLTVKEVASRLRISTGAVYKAVSENSLNHYRIGSAIRISEDQLQSWLTSLATESAGRTDGRSYRHLDL